MQVTQQVYVAEEWVRNAQNRCEAESHSRREVEKNLGSLKEEKLQLAEKLKLAERECASAKAWLKNVEAQAGDQRKQLYTTQLNLATEKAAVLALKAELQKAKEAAQKATEAAKFAEEAAYERGVRETEERLAEEVADLCREYCTETWMETLNRAGVPVDSELRISENVFFPEHIRELPTSPPMAISLPLPPPEQIATASAPIGAVEASKGVIKDKSAEDSLTIKDVVSQAKATEKKSNAEGVKVKAIYPEKDSQSLKE